MTQASETFLYWQIEGGIATLTLDRPPLNVLHIPMLQQMEAALAELAETESVRVLLLRAEGKMFSAGVDVADHTAERVGEMIPLFNRVCRALAEFPVPTIAAVHGHALGGGCELVLCCDLAVMADGAKIGQPEIQLAAMAPVAALRLPGLIGYRRTAAMLFSGRNLTAQEALESGLVNAVVPADQVLPWAQEKAAQLAGYSRVALQMNKKALLISQGNWVAGLPLLEQLYLQDLMSTADAHEGLAAFLEKRQPKWSHE